jgi:hypothetical protein
MSIKTDAMIVGGIAIAILGALWWTKNAAGQAVSAVGDAIGNAADAVGHGIVSTVPYVNPADSQNIAYQGVNKVTQAMTGNSDQTFGGWIYDITH